MNEPYDYENRFRDPEFLAVWERWFAARGVWHKATDGGGGRGWFTPEHDIYNPDPDRMPSEKIKAAAREYLESRVAYLSWVKAHLPEQEA